MKHGHSTRKNRSPEYFAWQNMKQRCFNPKFKQYKDYGGRGISVCLEWCGPLGFGQFLADVGLRPSKNHSLDRKDNDKNYEPSNVRWADRFEQNNNSSKNVYLPLNGEIKTICQWSRQKGIPESVIRWRLKAGWSITKTLTAIKR